MGRPGKCGLMLFYCIFKQQFFRDACGLPWDRPPLPPYDNKPRPERRRPDLSEVQAGGGRGTSGTSGHVSPSKPPNQLFLKVMIFFGPTAPAAVTVI